MFRIFVGGGVRFKFDGLRNTERRNGGKSVAARRREKVIGIG